MRRTAACILIIIFLPLLCGCGSIYSNYREIENLLVVRTVGFDREDGGTRFSLASSAKDDGAPIRMATGGSSLTNAMERIRNYSSHEDIFYPHVEQILLGESAARVGVEDYLSFFCRSQQLRIDIPLYIVKGGTAEQAILDTGNEERGISEILRTEQSRLAVSGDSRTYSTADIYIALARSGAALTCAIKCEQSAEAAKDGDEMLTAIADGYAVIRDGKLCGYIGQELSPAVGIVSGSMGISDMLVSGPDGEAVTLELNHCRCKITPVWDGGRLLGFDFRIKISASINESERPLDLSDSRQNAELCEVLNGQVTELVQELLELSQTMHADFLGLNYIAELHSPRKYAALSADFPALLPELEMRVSVTSRISHTNNISNG